MINNGSADFSAVTANKNKILFFLLHVHREYNSLPVGSDGAAGTFVSICKTDAKLGEPVGEGTVV